MRYIIGFTLSLVLLLGFTLACHAQAGTDVPPAIVPVPAQSSLVDAITKLVEAIGSLGAAVLILARLLRKVIPDGIQTGAAGTLLKHISLEVNPQLTPTPPNVLNPAVELKDTATGAKVEPVKNLNP